MNTQDHVVFVVDDDRGICEALAGLLSTFDLHTVTSGSAAEYLAYPKPDVPACLILDVQLPHINGLDLNGRDPRDTSSSCEVSETTDGNGWSPIGRPEVRTPQRIAVRRFQQTLERSENPLIIVDQVRAMKAGAARSGAHSSTVSQRCAWSRRHRRCKVAASHSHVASAR